MSVAGKPPRIWSSGNSWCNGDSVSWGCASKGIAIISIDFWFPFPNSCPKSYPSSQPNWRFHPLGQEYPSCQHPWGLWGSLLELPPQALVPRWNRHRWHWTDPMKMAAGATSSWGSYRWRRTLSPWIRNLVFCFIMIIIPSQGYHHFPHELCMITPTPPAISIKKKPPQPLRVKEVGQLDQKLNAKKHSNSTEILGTSPERCAHLTHAAKEGREYHMRR